MVSVEKQNVLLSSTGKAAINMKNEELLSFCVAKMPIFFDFAAVKPLARLRLGKDIW
ncbi:MAG: hypothetical protein WC464_05635 [Bdellovibrionales bacterium]